MRVIAGDVGGTKTLLALVEKRPQGWEILHERRFGSRDHAGLSEILTAFLEECPGAPDAASVGAPGPVEGNRVRSTNLPWAVDGEEIARVLGLPRAHVMNDFAAQAIGVLELQGSDLAPLNPGADAPTPRAPVAVLGAGTGLGEAILLLDGRRPVVVPSEGGHADFAPRTEREIALLRHLTGRFGRVSYERVLSGPGLANVYRFLLESAAGPGDAGSGIREALARGEDIAPLVSAAALAGEDPLAGEALDLFVTLYGAEAGNLALRAVARGGVYVTGGIAAKILPALRSGAFLEAFRAKGRLKPFIEKIPVNVVLNGRCGLLGAAAEAIRVLED